MKRVTKNQEKCNHVWGLYDHKCVKCGIDSYVFRHSRRGIEKMVEMIVKANSPGKDLP
jgi:hypothetical protein